MTILESAETSTAVHTGTADIRSQGEAITMSAISSAAEGIAVVKSLFLPLKPWNPSTCKRKARQLFPQLQMYAQLLFEILTLLVCGNQ
jgi:hypothetical protein